jgi:hypothetical protein
METRVIKIVVNKGGDPVFSERAITVEIVDEAAGEFVEVCQNCEPKLAIDPDEWPALRSAINRMIRACR